MVGRGLAVARAFSCERRQVLLEASRLSRTALVEVEPNQLLFDAPSEFFWLHTRGGASPRRDWRPSRPPSKRCVPSFIRDDRLYQKGGGPQSRP